VREGKLTAGHARTLVTVDNPLELARQIIAKGLSVRAAERLAKAPSERPEKPTKPKSEKDADTRALESDLSAALGMKVRIEHKGPDQAGALTVSYKTLDQLDQLCGKLSD